MPPGQLRFAAGSAGGSGMLMTARSIVVLVAIAVAARVAVALRSMS